MLKVDFVSFRIVKINFVLSSYLQDLSKHLKSAPDDSLLHNLVTALVMVNMHHGGIRGVAQLWQEFVLEMRYRWENKFLISG